MIFILWLGVWGFEVGVLCNLDKIKPLLFNEKLIICNMPIARYETNAYSVDEDNTLEKIVNHLEKDNIVLLFRPLVIDGVLNFKSRLTPEKLIFSSTIVLLIPF